jgi:hypothetical protein
VVHYGNPWPGPSKVPARAGVAPSASEPRLSPPASEAARVLSPACRGNEPVGLRIPEPGARSCQPPAVPRGFPALFSAHVDQRRETDDFPDAAAEFRARRRESLDRMVPLARTGQRHAGGDEQDAEGEEGEVPAKRTAEVVAHVMDAEQLVVDQALD